MNKEFNGFDEMVEALEENEDMVECKECFELFPKVDCERSDIGYVCPVCRGLRTPVAQAKFEDPYDCYTQDFPDVQEYDPGTMKDYEEEPSLGDALSDLIEDEYEAIEGYEVADETVQHATIDGDTKDEILDTLDHIKEEEEEHIDELKELCPDCDPVEEPKAEPEKLEEAADDEVEEIPEEDIPEEEAEDSEENENEEVSDLDSAYEAALEIANESGVGQVFGYARKETEEFVAIEPFEVDDPDAVEDDLMAVYDDVAYAYVAYPEKELAESLFESAQLNEVTGKIQRGWDTLKNKARAGLRKLTKAAINIDDIFYKGYYIHIENVPEDDMVDADGKPLQDRTTDTLEAAERLAINVSKRLPRAQVYLKGEDEGVKIEDRELQKLIVNKHDWKLARYRGGKVSNSAIEAINKRIKELELSADNIDATSVGTRSSSLDKAKKAAKETLGAKLDPKDYTPESYSAYSASFDSIVSDIDNARSEEELKKLNIETLKKDAEKLLKKKAGGSTDPEDDDLNLDDDDDELDLEAESLDEIKERLKTELGEMVAADPYTEESYKKYTSKYNQVVAFIEKFKTIEAAKKFDVEKYKTQLAGFLVKKPEPVPEEPEDIPEGPEDTGDDTDTEDTGDGTEEEEPENTEDTDEDSEETPAEGTTGKLSEVSEEQLKKLFTAVTGQGVGDNKKWQKVLKRMRAKLQELGESLDPSDYKPEDFIEEDLQSEADAIKSLKDTEATLKSAVDGIKNMTSAMREEYHRYANPAELKAMEDLEAIIEAAKNDALSSMQNWGIDISESDAQGWMSGNNEYSYQFMLDYEGIDEDEEEDIQDQLQNLVENAILSQYTLPPELSDISVSVALPDRDIAYDDEDGEELQDVKRASLFVDVTFARNLF